MAKHYLATRREDTVRLFRCERCGTRGDVSFRAVGISGLHREGLLNDNAILDAGEDAEVELRHDAERVLAFVRCPTCQRRPPDAIFWAGARVVVWAGLGLGIAAVVGFPLWLLSPPLAAGFGASELLRIRRAKRAVFHKLRAGEPETPAPLPVARAIAVAPTAATPPLAPLAAPAPPRPESRDPTTAPTLLGEPLRDPNGRE